MVSAVSEDRRSKSPLSGDAEKSEIIIEKDTIDTDTPTPQNAQHKTMGKEDGDNNSNTQPSEAVDDGVRSTTPTPKSVVTSKDLPSIITDSDAITSDVSSNGASNNMLLRSPSPNTNRFRHDKTPKHCNKTPGNSNNTKSDARSNLGSVMESESANPTNPYHSKNEHGKPGVEHNMKGGRGDSSNRHMSNPYGDYDYGPPPPAHGPPGGYPPYYGSGHGSFPPEHERQVNSRPGYYPPHHSVVQQGGGEAGGNNSGGKPPHHHGPPPGPSPSSSGHYNHLNHNGGGSAGDYNGYGGQPSRGGGYHPQGSGGYGGNHHSSYGRPPYGSRDSYYNTGPGGLPPHPDSANGQPPYHEPGRPIRGGEYESSYGHNPSYGGTPSGSYHYDENNPNYGIVPQGSFPPPHQYDYNNGGYSSHGPPPPRHHHDHYGYQHSPYASNPQHHHPPPPTTTGGPSPHPHSESDISRTVSSSFEHGPHGGSHNSHPSSKGNTNNRSNNDKTPNNNNNNNPSSTSKLPSIDTTNPSLAQDIAVHHERYKSGFSVDSSKLDPLSESSSWQHLTKVASLDHTELGRKKGVYTLPLSLGSSHRGPLTSLDSLSSVASAQEELPLPLEDGSTSSKPDFPRTRALSECTLGSLVDPSQNNKEKDEKNKSNKRSRETESSDIPESSSSSSDENNKKESDKMEGVTSGDKKKDSSIPENSILTRSKRRRRSASPEEGPPMVTPNMTSKKKTFKDDSNADDKPPSPPPPAQQVVTKPKAIYPPANLNQSKDVEPSKELSPLSEEDGKATPPNKEATLTRNTSFASNGSGSAFKGIDAKSKKSSPSNFVKIPNRASMSPGSISLGLNGLDSRSNKSFMNNDPGGIMMMPSMPSWEIQNQDSFASGALTVGSNSNNDRGGIPSSNDSIGLPLPSSFSFPNDYNTNATPSHSLQSGYGPPRPPNNIHIERRDSAPQNTSDPHDVTHPPHHAHPGPPQYAHPPRGGHQESRNQSFDSYGHHVGRSHSMDNERDMHPGHHYSNERGGPPPQHHGGPYDPYGHHRSGGPEDRTGIVNNGSFGAPPPPIHHHHPHHSVPYHHDHPHARSSSPPPPPGHWGPPPPYHHGGHGPPHGPVPSHSFGSTSSHPPSQYPPHHASPHYHHSQYHGRPPSPRHNIHSHAPDEFQPPSHEYLNHSKPTSDVYIMSSSSRRMPNDPTMSVRASMKGVYCWTKEDDARLTDIMKKYRNPKDWAPIAKDHGRGKSPKECHERWIRYLKPGVRKGQWQDHEDAIVLEAVTTSAEQPFTRWSDLAQRLPGRVGKQVRDRWVNHLNPAINHMPFTREDDLLLFKGHQELGKRWVEISTKFFDSTRSENHIKNRWYSASFKKFVSNEYGPDAYQGAMDSKKKDKNKKIESSEENKKIVETPPSSVKVEDQ